MSTQRIEVERYGKEVDVKVHHPTPAARAALMAVAARHDAHEVSVIDDTPEMLWVEGTRSGASYDLHTVADDLASAPAPVAAASTEPRHRTMVREGSVRVGESIDGLPVTGLGRAWTVDDEENCRWGAQPGTTCRVQYAYHR